MRNGLRAWEGWYHQEVFSGCVTGLRPEDLDLSATLTSGQVFRWQRDPEGAWRGVIEGTRRTRLLSAQDGALYWEADGVDTADAEQAVRSFLRLGEVDFPALAEDWCRGDDCFADAWIRQPGVRVLRQHPEECFFSFLCASVAPIARISAMLKGVTSEWGAEREKGGADPAFVAFPTARDLAHATEQRLRDLGLGFRARRVAEAARALSLLPPDHLSALRTQATHEEARSVLCAFYGVGWKIADCICLFSLDKDGAIPVDTHIWRIARARYAPELQGKSLSPASYDRVTEVFQDRFGPCAGWAQQTLFYRAAVARS